MEPLQVEQEEAHLLVQQRAEVLADVVLRVREAALRDLVAAPPRAGHPLALVRPLRLREVALLGQVDLLQPELPLVIVLGVAGELKLLLPQRQIGSVLILLVCTRAVCTSPSALRVDDGHGRVHFALSLPSCTTHPIVDTIHPTSCVDALGLSTNFSTTQRPGSTSP